MGCPLSDAHAITESGETGAGALAGYDKQPNTEQAGEATGSDLPELTSLIACAEQASTLLKAMGHDGRLTILCHLRTGPKSVTELENLLSARQAIVSQQLARLRLEGLVSARREGQAIFYSLLDPKVEAMIEVLARLYMAERG